MLSDAKLSSIGTKLEKDRCKGEEITEPNNTVRFTGYFTCMICPYRIAFSDPKKPS